MEIRNIIFDLGGVLLNIDYQASIKAFKDLGVKDFDALFSQATQHHLFDRLDTGQISAEEFRDELRELGGLSLSDAQIDHAWNAMLGDFPASRIDLLQGLSAIYRLFLLSNTNSIHYPAYIERLRKDHGIDSLDHLFENAYLSHEIGLRKPDTAAFQLIINENQLDPAATFFIDDSAQHVEGAIKAGLHAVWLDLGRMKTEDLFTWKYRLRTENL